VRTLLKVFGNSLAQVIGKFITAGVTILIAALVSRSLGQDGFGGFTIMTTYAAMFYMASDFGFNALVLREAGGDAGALKVGFERLLGLRLVYSLVLIFISLSILSFFPYNPEIKLATIVSALTILTQAIYNSANLIFQGRLRYDLSVVAAAIGSLASLAFIYILAQHGLNLFLVAVSYVAAGLATAGVGLGLARSLVGRFSPRFETGEWVRLVFLTFPLGLTLVFNLIYFRADIFILSFFRPTAEVGIYGSAYKLFELAISLPAFFMNALYPVLISYYEKDRVKFREMMRWSILGLAGSGVIMALLGIFLAPALINIIYGPGFSDAVLPMQLLFASVPIYFLSSLYLWVMVLLRRQKTLALVYLFGMLLNIALNLYFVPQFSYNAAAIITGVSEAIILALTYLLSRDWKNEVPA
jgi:O-antigen/teichoic acid export membrane protein